MNQLLRLSASLLVLAVAAVSSPVIAQVAIERADVESWVNVPITSYSWDVNDNAPGSSMPDTTALASIIAGGEADFRSIVKDLKRSGGSLLKTMPANVVGADSFPAATHVELLSFVKPGGGDSTIHRFSVLADGSLTHLGIAGNLIDTDQNGVIDTIASRYLESGWKDREFPAGTGGSWQSSFTQRTWVKAPVIGPFLVVGTTEEREYNVAGTTTLTTPGGSAPAIILHIHEFIAQPQGGVNIALERFSYITKNGMAVTVAYRLDNRQSRQRTGINDIAWFMPGGSSSVATYAESRTDFTLGQNYPNPCATATSIPFTLRRPGQVRLALYDALGRMVMNLIDGPMDAGAHDAAVQVHNLPDGVYTCRLQVDDHTTGRTMLIRN